MYLIRTTDNTGTEVATFSVTPDRRLSTTIYTNGVQTDQAEHDVADIFDVINNFEEDWHAEDGAPEVTVEVDLTHRDVAVAGVSLGVQLEQQGEDVAPLYEQADTILVDRGVLRLGDWRRVPGRNALTSTAGRRWLNSPATMATKNAVVMAMCDAGDAIITACANTIRGHVSVDVHEALALAAALLHEVPFTLEFDTAMDMLMTVTALPKELDLAVDRYVQGYHCAVHNDVDAANAHFARAASAVDPLAQIAA